MRPTRRFMARRTVDVTRRTGREPSRPSSLCPDSFCRDATDSRRNSQPIAIRVPPFRRSAPLNLRIPADTEPKPVAQASMDQNNSATNIMVHAALRAFAAGANWATAESRNEPQSTQLGRCEADRAFAEADALWIAIAYPELRHRSRRICRAAASPAWWPNKAPSSDR